MARAIDVGIDGKLLIMPAILEAFGWALAFKTIDKLGDHAPWMSVCEYGLAAIALIIGGVVWFFFLARLAEIWPWRKLRIARKELADAIAENTDLKRQIADVNQAAALPPSKLTIHSAIYRALVPDAKVIDVTDCLKGMIAGNGLVLQIQNENFRVGDRNWVENDPCNGEKKWLQVEYSFDGRPRRTIERREDYRLVLPEDTFIKAEIERIGDEARREKIQQDSDLWRAQESRRQCEEERQAALASIGGLNANPSLSSLFSPLQIEVLHLSRDLQRLRKDAEPAPEFQDAGPMKNGEDSRTWTIQKLIETHVWSNEYAIWARKFIYSYEAQFAHRVRNIMTSIGQATGLVVFPLKPYTETVRPGDDFQQLLDILMDFFSKLENPNRRQVDTMLESIAPPSEHTLFSPLQIEAFTLAKELRDFYAFLGPFPSDPVQYPGEDEPEYLERLHNPEKLGELFAARREQQGRWQQKLSHGFANRQFGQRITALMHRAGEEFNLDYPALLPSWAGIAPPLSADGIPKLAQEMEMVAIWINRKQRNEVDLLHPKS
jgi:hypothetical protein